MMLLPPLLLAAGSLVPVFALPHSEATATRTLVARQEDAASLPDLPTLAPASWCQEVPNGEGDVVWHTATGPCTYNTLRGAVTLVGTDWIAVKPTETPIVSSESGGPSADDDRCIIKYTSTARADGKLFWSYDDEDGARNQCIDYCANSLAADKENDEIGSSTCFKNDGKPYIDELGNEPSDDSPVGTEIYGVGQCICDWPLLNDLVDDLVTEALPAIAEITCKTFYTAIDSVISAGMNAIPGLGAVGAAGVSIAAQAAEVMAWTFSDPNAASQHYKEWLDHPSGDDSDPAAGTEQPSTSLMDSICGNQYTPQDAEKIFNTFQFAANFASAPKLFAGAAKSWPPPFEQGEGSLDDALDYIKGLRKPKGDEGKSDLKPTQPKPTQPEPTQPKPTDKPSATETTDKPQQTSEKQQACKRGDDACTVTSYLVDEMVPKEEVIPMTCDHKLYPEACAGYYSAIYENGDIIPAQYTCSKWHNAAGRKGGKATEDWTKQHKDRKWWSFTAAEVLNVAKNRMEPPACQADEFPPDYFLDEAKTMTQLVRWIPRFDNAGGGKTWAGFCDNNDGNVGNGQRVKPRKDQKDLKSDDPKLEFNTEKGLIKLEDLEVKTAQDKKTVTSRWKRATYTKAVFSMAFSYVGDETPRKENNWWLEENRCWPKDIVPEDPGFAILTSDKWYDPENRNGFPNAESYTASYTQSPSPDMVQAAEARRARGSGKHRPDDSPEGQPDTKDPKTNTPPEKRAEFERLELFEGRLVARDLETNATRPLTRDEFRDQVEILNCKDKQCSEELRGRGMDDNTILIPAVPPPSSPSANRDAVPTYVPTQSMRTEVRPERRTNVSPDLPMVTML